MLRQRRRDQCCGDRKTSPSLQLFMLVQESKTQGPAHAETRPVGWWRFGAAWQHVMSEVDMSLHDATCSVCMKTLSPEPEEELLGQEPI